jgi:hypothetical protein
MKKLIIIALFIILNIGLLAQAPPPPPPDPSSGGNGPVGSPLGAPIDGGLAVFLTFAAGYAALEWRKRNQVVKR